jgi:hypothetical protein
MNGRKQRIGRRPILKLKTQELIPSEYEECKAFWHYCQRIIRLGRSVHHIPNEGMRQSWYTKALIMIGLLPGALDYFIQKPNQKWHGIYIDMKRKDQREKNKDSEQEAFIENALKDGYYATYAYGCDDAIKIYTDYINNRI